MRSLVGVFAIGIAGCSTSDLGGTLLAPFDHPTGLFVDEFAYVSASDGVFQVPLDGGASTQLVDVGSNDPTTSYSASAVAMDNDALYVVVSTQRTTPVLSETSSLSRLPKNGGSQLTILDSGAGSAGVDDSFVYYATTTSIDRVPKDGSGPSQSIASVTPNGLGVDSLAVDDSFVYWAAAIPVINDAGVGEFPTFDSVQRVPKAGGLSETLTTVATLETALTVDDAGRVYWCDSSDASRSPIVRFDEATHQITVVQGSYNCDFGGPIRVDATHRANDHAVEHNRTENSA